MNEIEIARLIAVLADVKRLAVEYYNLTKKPLGVTGEVAEYVAAEKLGLELASARTAGYDAIRHTAAGPVRIQIKGRAVGKKPKPGQRLGSIKRDAKCDAVLLVLLSNESLEPVEMWEAPMESVRARLSIPGSKSRNERGALSLREFQRLDGARLQWRAGTPLSQPTCDSTSLAILCP